MGLKERLRFDEAAGAVHDGERRYVLMRPDVVMGVLHGLDDATRARVLAAWCEAARVHGSGSLRAYAANVGPDAQAIITATVDAARDLGWGRWTVRSDATVWRLTVHGSPFAQGGAAQARGVAANTLALCAPVAGLFAALVETATGAAAGVAVVEAQCAAQGAPACEFEAHLRACPA